MNRENGGSRCSTGVGMWIVGYDLLTGSGSRVISCRCFPGWVRPGGISTGSAEHWIESRSPGALSFCALSASSPRIPSARLILKFIDILKLGYVLQQRCWLLLTATEPLVPHVLRDRAKHRVLIPDGFRCNLG